MSFPLPFSSRVRAFSLLEVTIAIAIAAVGIIALLGLMSTSFNAGRESTSDIVLADLAKSVAADLRSRPFDPPVDPLATNSSLKSLASPYLLYFTVDGKSTTEANAYYKCAVTLTSQADFNTVTTSAINLYEARIDFTWPAPGTAFNKTFSINLGRYAD